MLRIREMRQARGLSQTKLAREADMDPATLNRIERGNGNPNIKTLLKLAHVLETTVGELVEDAHEYNEIGARQ